MFPYHNQTMIDAVLLDHRQMVQREMERNYRARLARPPTTPTPLERVTSRLRAALRARAVWNAVR